LQPVKYLFFFDKWISNSISESAKCSGLSLHHSGVHLPKAHQISQVARPHNLNPKLLYRWMKSATHADWKETGPHAKKVAFYTPSPTEFREMETQNDPLKRLLGEKDLLRDLLKKQPPLIG